jgi:hypothetical protein
MILRLTIAFLSFSTLLFAQKSDTLVVDSIPVHSVKKAVILSAIIPSSGQIYNHLAIEKGVKGKNKVYWKVPLIYSALGATSYFLIQNQLNQLSAKNEYKFRDANPSIEFLDIKWQDYDKEGILSMYQKYSTRRDLSILAFGAVYLIQIIDAGIEAHFVNFDISEDLSLKINPVILNRSTIGIGMSFNFR